MYTCELLSKAPLCLAAVVALVMFSGWQHGSVCAGDGDVVPHTVPPAGAWKQNLGSHSAGPASCIAVFHDSGTMLQFRGRRRTLAVVVLAFGADRFCSLLWHQQQGTFRH